MVSKRSSILLLVAGVFNIVIWPRFFKAIVDDKRAWTGRAWHSSGTSFLWVHVVLIVTALTFGVIVLTIGVKAFRSPR